MNFTSIFCSWLNATYISIAFISIKASIEKLESFHKLIWSIKTRLDYLSCISRNLDAKGTQLSHYWETMEIHHTSLLPCSPSDSSGSACLCRTSSPLPKSLHMLPMFNSNTQFCFVLYSLHLWYSSAQAYICFVPAAVLPACTPHSAHYTFKRKKTQKNPPTFPDSFRLGHRS